MKYASIFIFIIIQILFLPLSIIGFAMFELKNRLVSKKIGVSATASSAIAGKYMVHLSGTYKDNLAGKLFTALPNVSIVGFWFIFFPSYVRYKIYPAKFEAGKETITSIARRSAYFDKIIERHKNKVEQFVIMGAGFDTRAYGDLIKCNLKFFELDQINTQKLKIETLKKTGIDCSHVTFVDVDFTTENWYDKLVKSGYSPITRTMFLWEGVTAYLSENEVRKTIKEIQGHCALGSVLAVDFYASRIASKKSVKTTNEMFYFTMDFSHNAEHVLKTFLESENLTLGDFYFMGHKASDKGAIGVVTEIIL
jgi:methyltransferase (TIGR00027 family)